MTWNEKSIVLTIGLTLIQKACAFCPGYPQRYEAIHEKDLRRE